MKKVFISGVSRGIGLEILRKLHNNYKVSGSTSNYENFKKVINELNLDSDEFCEINAMDLIDENHFQQSSIMIPGDIDVLINNAGIGEFKNFDSTDLNILQSHLDINLKFPYLLTKAVLPGMLLRKSGIIINILSVAIRKPFTNSSVYSASKAAVAAMFDSLREEVRTEGIKIANVYVGATDTDIWHPKVREKYSQRMLSAKDVAESISSLIELNSREKIMVEEIVIRPQLGDL